MLVCYLYRFLSDGSGLGRALYCEVILRCLAVCTIVARPTLVDVSLKRSATYNDAIVALNGFGLAVVVTSRSRPEIAAANRMGDVTDLLRQCHGGTACIFVRRQINEAMFAIPMAIVVRRDNRRKRLCSSLCRNFQTIGVDISGSLLSSATLASRVSSVMSLS